MKPVWAARTGPDVDASFAAFSQSVDDDAPLLAHDVQGSVAHVAGLLRAGLLSPDEATALINVLQDAAAAFAAGDWNLDPALEDGHMNLEALVTEAVGAAGKKLHTGRSRNDQVATCIVLYARSGLADLASGLQGLVRALADQAERHAETPWVASTHDQPAQPATLGFLLIAHAWRLHDALRRVQATAVDVSESPLGSGAVAGSTLPLDPAYTAQLLGLRPPRNALLATGARDAIRATTAACDEAGMAIASLAEEVVHLFSQGTMRLPPGLTTGSSMMPQKRNPDALELVRARALALAGHRAAVDAVTRGLRLGYVRDLQVTKPALVASCTEATACARMLATAVAGAEFDVAALASAQMDPGITATDAAEALVAAGLPFRVAYQHVASYHAALEAGASAAEAMDVMALPPRLATAFAGALTPDPLKRTTLGAPGTVADQLAILAAAMDASDAVQATMDAAIDAAEGLLIHAPEHILA